MPSHEEGVSHEREPLIDDQTRRAYGPFGFAPEQLGRLVDPKNTDLLEEYGGVEKILEGLKVDPTVGLSSDEGLESVSTKKNARPFKERREHFGKNVLPETTQRSFFSLVWEAYQDRTLILLSIAALVSLAVGIGEDYSSRHPEGEPRVGWLLRDGKEQQISVYEINVGDILGLRGEGNEETPLQQKLDLLAEQIAKLGVSVALIMLM
ncbi:18356_t:CDS:2 [Entrophospora sp. SA101]|nr:18356_t:CDS:2 [Entrophospora sp. SA101]